MRQVHPERANEDNYGPNGLLIETNLPGEGELQTATDPTGWYKQVHHERATEGSYEPNGLLIAANAPGGSHRGQLQGS